MPSRRLAAFVAAITLACIPATADAHVALTKREARDSGLIFAAPFVDLLDLNRTVRTIMVPPRLCQRINTRTVTCGFWAYLEADGRIVAGDLRIHRQHDGLLGYKFPIDVLREGLR